MRVPITKELAFSVIDNELRLISVGALLAEAVSTAELFLKVSDPPPVPALDTSVVTAVLI